MKTVGIVGASGKLGRYMVKHCLDRGYQVRGVCREKSVRRMPDTFGKGAPGLTRGADHRGDETMRRANAPSTLILVLLLLAARCPALADSSPTANAGGEGERNHFVGSTLFLLGNLAPGDPPYFFQLNYGHHLTPRDILTAEAITWTYYEPLGTYGSSDRSYPGKIRAYGIGVGYQRLFPRKLYLSTLAVPFRQTFFDTEDTRIQHGFQLFLQLRFGGHFEFFSRRWFLEPSVAFNYWPVNTHFPASFKEIEKGKHNYFLGEPGLHFGWRF